ncbi:MAG: hydroxymethylglutaryl-CoA synthase family protein [Promethearchaeota archaeon]
MTFSQTPVDTLFSNIGIDSIGFYAPHFYLSLGDLARVRDVNPDKFKFGLLSSEIRIPERGKDAVSLGLKAAYNALLRGNISPKEIDALFVGSEATVYAVKSISNIYKDVLGLSNNCLTQDVSNACAASSIAVLNAVAMIEMGVIKKALVIAVDISSYELKSPGEPTQGAGAVAMVLCRNPRIAVFGKKFGKVSSNINDFYRPEGEKNAQVFGQYSIQSYLNLQMDSYNDLMQNIGKFYANYYLFHAPYGKLPLKFMQKMIIEHGLNNINFLMKYDPQNERIVSDLKYFNDLPQEYVLSKKLIDSIDSMDVSLEKRENIKLWVELKIRNTCLPPLQIPALFGNMYSAAIWAEFMFVVENYSNVNDTIYFGSYGSGAVALSGLLKVQPKFRTVLSNSLGISNFLSNKVQKSVEEYEELRSHEHVKDSSLMWAKLSFSHNYGVSMRYCEEGCQLSSHQVLNYCPKGHKGNKKIFFPIIGTISELKQYIPGDLTPLYQGYVFTKGSLTKIGDLVEYDLRRWQNNYESHSKHGLLNWIPIYRAVHYSPYLDYIEEYVTAQVSESVTASAPSHR